MNFHNEIILHRKKEKKTKWAPFGAKNQSKNINKLAKKVELS